MDKKSQTVDTYNKSAIAMAAKFDNIGIRISDINETFNFVHKKNPIVLEIGCGNGRDAQEIVKRTDRYLGIDISSELIRLAREKVPQGKFEVQDIENFEFPKELDVVFAFASLIHVDKMHLSGIMENISKSLASEGIVMLSLKYSDAYEEVTNRDEFGIRTYYHYSDKDIKTLVKDFNVLKSEVMELRGQKWLEIILQKK
jgi:SAM-dependent methyltransferase